MDSSQSAVLQKILVGAAKRRAASIHFAVNVYPMLRVDGQMVELRDEQLITPQFIEQFADSVLTPEQKKILTEQRELTTVVDLAGKFRLKVNLFYQKNSLAAAIRIIPIQIPLLINLGLPKSMYKLSELNDGLVIIAGPYGSGRSTTAASILEEINKTRKATIVTIEKPLEFLHTNKLSLIEQREVGRDVNSFADALRYCQEIDVDVISVGVNSETETLPLVVEFASSGRLVVQQMDTVSVLQTIEEIIAAFGKETERAQTLLAAALQAIIVQRLVPRVGGGLALAAEVLIANGPVRSLIGEGRNKQLTTILQSSRAEGMSTLDQSLADLVRSGEVLLDHAVEYADDPNSLRTRARGNVS